MRLKLPLMLSRIKLSPDGPEVSSLAYGFWRLADDPAGASVARVREKIEANLEADLSLESLAEESGYSRAHFLRMFRAATGLTPHQYVIEVRLARAQERLRQAGSSIVDVAASCGFASQAHMTSVFRARLGVTPARLKKAD